MFQTILNIAKYEEEQAKRSKWHKSRPGMVENRDSNDHPLNLSSLGGKRWFQRLSHVIVFSLHCASFLSLTFIVSLPFPCFHTHRSLSTQNPPRATQPIIYIIICIRFCLFSRLFSSYFLSGAKRHKMA